MSLAERPDLIRPMSRFNGSVWPTFMLQDSQADSHWHHFDEDFPEFQLILLDSAGEIAATNNSAPLAWDGTDDGLPEGWDDQVERTVQDLLGGAPVNTLGAIQIVVDPVRRGGRLGGVMVQAMQANGRARGYGAVIACVRPTEKDRYPPFDAWIRLHVRLGARVVRGSPRAMTIRGSIADWEGWTGDIFPGTGDYILPFAAAPIHIDREADEGIYYDPNVWVVHPLA